DRLVEPIRKSNEVWFEKNSSLLQNQTTLWVAHGRPDGMLLRGKELEQAIQESQAKTISRDEADFLNACRKAREREQREKRGNLWIRILAISATVALFATIYFAYQNGRAQRQVQVSSESEASVKATATVKAKEQGIQIEALQEKELIQTL